MRIFIHPKKSVIGTTYSGIEFVVSRSRDVQVLEGKNIKEMRKNPQKLKSFLEKQENIYENRFQNNVISENHEYN